MKGHFLWHVSRTLRYTPPPFDCVDTQKDSSEVNGICTCLSTAVPPLPVADPRIEVMAWPARKNASANPYQKLLYDAMEDVGEACVSEISVSGILRGNYDVLHVHWPDGFVGGFPSSQARIRLLILQAVVRMAKARGIKILWTAHNLRSHARLCGPAIEDRFWAWWTRAVDGVIYLSKPSRDEAFATYPALAHKPAVVTRHGHYRHLDPAAAARPNDEGDPATILFFGSITPYKGVATLLRMFERERPRDMRLRIVGKVSNQYDPTAAFVHQLNALPDNRAAAMSASLGYQSDAKLIEEVQRAQLVVLPYEKIHNSGSAIFALSFNTPVLVPRLPVFDDLNQAAGAPWVQTYSGPLTTDTLRSALAATSQAQYADLGAFEWSNIAAATCDFYRSLL